MAVLADIGCLNVGRVLAERVRTVVAAYAVGRDVGVIEIGCGYPGGGNMAIITSVPGRNVCRMFASRNDPVVTRATISDDLGCDLQ